MASARSTVSGDGIALSPASRAFSGAVMLVVMALLATLLSVGSVFAAAPANAESNSPGAPAFGTQAWSAYVGAGESVDIGFTRFSGAGAAADSVVFTVTDPAGVVMYTCTHPGRTVSGATCDAPPLTSAAAGVWTIQMTVNGDQRLQYFWDISVRAASGAATPGRVWSNNYSIKQVVDADLQYWLLDDSGYQYQVSLDQYNGIYSSITANSVGNTAADCTPLNQSIEGGQTTPTQCGPRFRVFFQEPAADLPATAQSANGTVTIKPAPLTADDLTVDNLVFVPSAAGSASGAFSYDINTAFSGAYELQVDTDGNGSYDDAQDRIVTLSANGSGAYTYDFDGLDGQGNVIADCTLMNARIFFPRVGEMHVLQGDVEGRGGIEIVRTNGPGAPNATIYWNDTNLSTDRSGTTPVVDGRAGVDSTGGVHGWAYPTGSVVSWGDERIVDDWTYVPMNFGTGDIAIGGTCLTVTKTSSATADSRVGDTITYAVTATNTGDTAYTAEQPAVFSDDLTGVLDDATYNNDATADVAGDTTYTSPTISWSGALAAGATVTLTYTATVVSGGDGSMRNVAFSGDGDTPACDPPNEGGEDPATGIACAEVEDLLPRLSIEKTADRTDLPTLGEDVTYTLVVTNEGPGDYTVAAPATVTDDFSAVIDDADFVPTSLDASVGTATYDAPVMSWSGALAAGASATIEYTFTFAGGGDNILRNQACIAADDAAPGAALCDAVVVPAAQVQQSKSVDPATGTTVRAGQQVSYTLTFDSVGETAGTVNTFDDVSDVLDDAQLSSGPTVTGVGLTAALNGEQLDITGSIEPGVTVTVSYTVIVDAFADQVNHTLGNVLADPDGNACIPGPEACATENPIQHLSLEKTSDAATDVNTGDTVTYSVTLTNDGESDFTAESPATVDDDLAAVLDDALYQDDAEADTEDGDLSYAEPVLTWTGPLAAGESVTVTYTILITNAGDHELTNVAALPAALCDEADAPCEVRVETPLPHVIPTKISDPATGTDVVAGQVVTYTLGYTNDGLAAGVVDSTDDLSDVLDDADITLEPTADSAEISVVRDGAQLRVDGPIAAGATVLVTYQVTIKADGDRGNNTAENVLVPDVPQEFDCATGDCVPVTPPPVVHLMPEIDDWKTSDPASGTTVAPGASVSYTLHFTNTGTAIGTVSREDALDGVLDDADVTTVPTSSDAALEASSVVDGRFAVTGALEPGQTVTVTYTVTVRGDGDRGDDQLANFLVDPGDEAPTECVVTDPERPDCTVNYVSNIVATKSSDPKSGSDVKQGENITYTLTFTNTSTNPSAADAQVEYTDHMSDVLDDAAFNSGPTTSTNALTAVRDGDTIAISGALATGLTATVTYTVTVESYGDQGNHILGNVIAITGTDPICVANSPLCTFHNPVKPPAGLASTGMNFGGAGLFGPLALLLGAAAVLIARRRNRAVIALSADDTRNQS
jgi:fimbrial isopeptide formation D2 family protein/uncharacterized repeat protein (TIGR01451 family)